MDDGLDRFEKDLKSLTPKRYPLASPVRTMLPIHDFGASPRPDAGIGQDQQLISSKSTNRNWLKTVAVSWATGLAAGMLISAIWTKLMTEETFIYEPNLVAENDSSASVSEPSTPLDVSSNPPSITPPRQQTASLLRGQGFVRNSRGIVPDFRDHQILHPFMPLNNVNWNAAMTPPAKRFTGLQTEANQSHEQPGAPNQLSDASHESLPSPFPKSQGQRQLLKSLMESDDLISI